MRTIKYRAMVKTFDGKKLPNKKFDAAVELNPGCYIIPEETFENVKIINGS